MRIIFGSDGCNRFTKSQRERQGFACILRRVFSTQVCLKEMVNNHRYVEGDISRSYAENGLNNTCRENLTVTRTPGSSRTPSRLRDHSFLAVWAIREIKSVKRLFGNKVTEYTLADENENYCEHIALRSIEFIFNYH